MPRDVRRLKPPGPASVGHASLRTWHRPLGREGVRARACRAAAVDGSPPSQRRAFALVRNLLPLARACPAPAAASEAPARDSSVAAEDLRPRSASCIQGGDRAACRRRPASLPSLRTLRGRSYWRRGRRRPSLECRADGERRRGSSRIKRSRVGRPGVAAL